MGSQHNTHIYNNSDETIKVVLTDNNNRTTQRIIQTKGLICIPTIHGTNSVSIFKKIEENQFSKFPVAFYTDESDRSFIVIKVDGMLEIVRSKYGFLLFIICICSNF